MQITNIDLVTVLAKNTLTAYDCLLANRTVSNHQTARCYCDLLLIIHRVVVGEACERVIIMSFCQLCTRSIRS